MAPRGLRIALIAAFPLAAAMPPALARDEAPRRAPRIPAMVTKWKMPGEETGPAREISIREIGICMGTELRLEERVDAVQAEESRLENDHASLQARSDALARELGEIEAEESRAAASAQSHRERSAELDRRRAAIDGRRGKSQSRAEVDRLNAQIAAFNRDVDAANRALAELRKSEEALKARIAAYNASVATLNEGVADFTRRSEAFRTAAEGFNDDLRYYATQCTGERRIRR